VEYNGIVVFDPRVLRAYYGGSIAAHANLFERYTTTEEGDDVLRRGIIVPILAIDDLGYDCIVKDAEERCPEEAFVCVENGVFPLRIEGKAIICDLCSVRDWEDGISVDYDEIDIAPGLYAVSILGYRKDDEKGHIEKLGYIFSFRREKRLPE